MRARASNSIYIDLLSLSRFTYLQRVFFSARELKQSCFKETDYLERFKLYCLNVLIKIFNLAFKLILKSFNY